MTLKRKILLLSCTGLGLMLGLYLVWSSIIYYRSTFFIYPDIKEKYDIRGKIDTPEEAIEACRSNLGVSKDGEYQNFMREMIWDSKLRNLKQYSGTSPMYFQIRVLKGLSDEWSVISSIESEDSRKCFNCFHLQFGPSMTGRCYIDFDGKRLK